MPETTRRFRLNEELPIPFDGWGRMEVDLLCAEARLVIELDGAQHLGDAEAYRRDRRKDALLQQNGYFVLRFLAEDLGKDLDYVLDSVFGALAHCGKEVKAQPLSNGTEKTPAALDSASCLASGPPVWSGHGSAPQS